jgi:integrase
MKMNRLERFFSTYSSRDTKWTYGAALKHFFSNIYPELELREACEQYFNEERNHEEDLDKFFASLKDRPPKTVRTYLSAIRTFLLENDVELPEKYWRKLRGRKKGSRALTIDKVPNNAELKQILMHMPIHGKALYLVLASSGMRIGEALKLKLSDVEFNKDPVKVYIRGEYTKSGNPRIAFISSEAREAVVEWLKVRNRYLEAASGKSHRYPKSREDERLFPFEGSTAQAIWINALSKAGYQQKDNSTNRLVVHPHVLRKFFRTQMGKVIPIDIVEALIGHEGYLTEVYRKYSEEDLAEFYRKGESSLLVFGSGTSNAKLAEIEERNKQLQSILNELRIENLELKEKMKKLESLITPEVQEVLLALARGLRK